MAIVRTIPKLPETALADGNRLLITPPWRQFWNNLLAWLKEAGTAVDDNTSAVATLQAAVATLQAAGWTFVSLANDFVTSNATAQDTGLAFTPAANTKYQIEGQFLLRTATATVGPRPGIAWPTGMTDGVARLSTTSAAATEVIQNGNIAASVLIPVGGLPNTTNSWPGDLRATLISGASPSGSFKVQLATETGATNVTMKAGSFIAYRTF